MTTRIATAAGAGADLRIFLPFSKVEQKADGSVYAEGIATAEVKDLHGEIVLHEASVAAFKEWTEWADKATGGESIGNIREMHDSIGAGKAVKWTVDDATKSNSLGALVVDAEAAKKTKARVYTGFSIGGDQVKREIREINGEKIPVITAYRLTEVSVVDKPACPVATFTMVKRFEEKDMKIEQPALTEGEAIVRSLESEGKPIAWLIAKKGDKGPPRVELAKDAMTSGATALAAIKQFMIDVLGMPGDVNIWTLDDTMSALRYMWFAACEAQADAAMDSMGVEAIAASVKMRTPKLGAGDTVTAAIHTEAMKDPIGWFVKRSNGKTERVVWAEGIELKKSDTPDDPPEEETSVTEEIVPKPKAPEPAAPTVPPVEGEPEKQAAVDLGPVLDAIAKIAETVNAQGVVLKALHEGGLTKASGAQDLTQLLVDVAGIKKAIESLPAPPAGRAIQKTLGDGSNTQRPDMDAFVKIAQEALAKAADQGVPKSALEQMGIAFTAEAMKRL